MVLYMLDVGMTNSTDFAVYDDLYAIDPAVKVLVSTVHDEREINKLYAEKVPFQVLYKPFSAQSFVSKVENMLQI